MAPASFVASSRDADRRAQITVGHRDGERAYDRFPATPMISGTTYLGRMRNVRFEASGSLLLPTPSRSCRRAEERPLWRSTDDGRGGWVGSEGVRPLFRPTVSEAAVPLSAKTGRVCARSHEQLDIIDTMN